ncbi:YycC family protein [Aneurinibacillus thermoaerophilus]|nr:YycC family protein [Aneurinibacillus thermoaerophilus]
MKPNPVSLGTAKRLSEELNVPIEQVTHTPQHILLQRLTELARKKEAKEIGHYIAPLGKKSLILGGQRGIEAIKQNITTSLNSHGISYHIEPFKGECSNNEINRMKKIGQAQAVDIIIGVGGGKAIDTAKAVSFKLNCPVAIVPIIASTDAPCSALSVIYNDEGVFEQYLVLPRNPDLVLLDTKVIAHSSVRQLVAGMGDALSTYFEAAACARARARNIAGGTMTQAALAIAKLCYEILLRDGYQAKIACEQNVVTEALNNIVEANTLLSGLGFESAGLAACHAIHNGLTILEETHPYCHGEKVAFGTIIQLVLENRSMKELEEVIVFCRSVGLPTTLADIGLGNATPEQIRSAADALSRTYRQSEEDAFLQSSSIML